MRNSCKSTRELHHIIPEVSKTTIHEDVTENLGYRKLCARWVPKMLTDDHKTKRLGSAMKFLTRYAQKGDEFLDLIVTGDETCVYQHTPESKQQSLQWRHTQSPRTKKKNSKLEFQLKKSGTEKAFSWSTSCFLAQKLMPLHIVTPRHGFDEPFKTKGGVCCHAACACSTNTRGPIPRTSPLRFWKNSSGMY